LVEEGKRTPKQRECHRRRKRSTHSKNKRQKKSKSKQVKKSFRPASKRKAINPGGKGGKKEDRKGTFTTKKTTRKKRGKMVNTQNPRTQYRGGVENGILESKRRGKRSLRKKPATCRRKRGAKSILPAREKGKIGKRNRRPCVGKAAPAERRGREGASTQKKDAKRVTFPAGTAGLDD